MTHHLGGTGGVFLAGIPYELTGGYTVTFVESVAILLLAVVASLLLSKNRPATEK